jgi:hypothetical protein
MQDYIRENQIQYQPKAWLKEYCTIRLAIGRQSGHTSLAIDLAQNRDAEVIVMRQQQVSQFAKEGIDRSKIYTFDNFDYPMMDKPLPEMVIVDTAMFFSKGNQDFLYSNLVSRGVKGNDKFVLLFLQ